MIRIGLTGNIACGKSTVAHILREHHGLEVIDCDQLARVAVNPGTSELARIVETFGTEILRNDGTLDRKKLRHIIMNDDQARSELEYIIHPVIRALLEESIHTVEERGSTMVVLENALLIETDMWKECNHIILVSCAPRTQIMRLMTRDAHTTQEAQTMIALQMPLSKKKKFATFIVENDGTRQSLELSVSNMVKKLWAS